MIFETRICLLISSKSKTAGRIGTVYIHTYVHTYNDPVSYPFLACKNQGKNTESQLAMQVSTHGIFLRYDPIT